MDLSFEWVRLDKWLAFRIFVLPEGVRAVWSRGLGPSGFPCCDWLFQGCGGVCGLCPKSRARRSYVPRLRRFILLGSFIGTLLVVSILDIVYDYHL